MHPNPDLVGRRWRQSRTERPDPLVHVLSSGSEAPAVDLSDVEPWLGHLIRRPDSPLDQKLVEAIGHVADELAKGTGPVQLIVTPATWHPFVDVVVFRAFREGIPPSLHILSLEGFEAMLWRPPYSLNRSPAPRRRARKPVELVFDLAEVVSPAEPTRWDLMLHVARAVREHLPAIERV
jgi:hypothetical protein